MSNRAQRSPSAHKACVVLCTHSAGGGSKLYVRMCMCMCVWHMGREQVKDSKGQTVAVHCEHDAEKPTHTHTRFSIYIRYHRYGHIYIPYILRSDSVAMAAQLISSHILKLRPNQFTFHISHHVISICSIFIFSPYFKLCKHS